MTTLFIKPGNPSESGYVESFNGSYRDECLNVHWFETIDEAIAKSEAWRVEYNEGRPHQALAEQTPAAFAKKQRSFEHASAIVTAGN